MTRRTDTTQPSEGAVADRVARERSRSVHTLRAARVLSYTVDDGVGPVADVQLVHREIVRLSGGRTEARPIAPLRDVPVLWPSGGGRGLVWGLQAGDPVYVQVREICHDGWDAGQRSGDAVPEVDRRHDWSDAVVLPMDTLVGRMDGAPAMLLQDGEALHVGSLTASEAPAMAGAVRQELDALWAALDGHAHGFTGVAAGAESTTDGLVIAPTTYDLSSRRILTDDLILPGVGVSDA